MTNRAPEPFPLIHVEGSPRDRGLSYGRQAGERIAIGVDLYREAFEGNGVDWNTALQRAGEFLSRIGQFDAAMAQEITAIAEGSEQSIEAIVALNARTEILFWRGEPATTPASGATPGMQEECTAAIALPAATADGHVLHGQNWDWNPRCEETSVVLRIDNNDGPNILTMVEAGQLARHGLNSLGIALTVNGLQCDHDAGHVGVPSPITRRRLLSSTTLGEALGTILSTPISFSHNLLVSHSEGVAIDIEATPLQNYWITPREPIFVHANHFKSEVARAQLKDLGLQQCPESLYRDQRLHAHLAARTGSIDIRTFQEGLADRFGSPDAVLRSPRRRVNGTMSGTVASLVMDTTERRMWIAPSPYKSIHYTEYSLAF